MPDREPLAMTFPLITEGKSKAIDAAYIVERALAELDQTDRASVIAFINRKFPARVSDPYEMHQTTPLSELTKGPAE